MQAPTLETLSRLTPLSGLGAETLAQILSLANFESFPRSKSPVAMDCQRKIIYLLKGELKINYPDGLVKILVGGHGEALLPLGSGRHAPVGIRPITDVGLLWFDESSVDILLTWDQLVPAASDRSAGVPAVADWRALGGMFDAHTVLGTFSSLPPAHIESLLASFKRQQVTAGKTVIRQGEHGDYYYVIERGRATVSREVAGAHIELAQLKAGDAFGEEALIAETCRNATVTMKTDGELLRLDGADFLQLLREPLLHRLNAEQAIKRVDAGGLWLDVRFSAEFKHDGLPGAINIPLNELRDAMPNMRRDLDYVAYCQSGRRSSAAAFLLSQRGLNAYLLEGGMKSLPVTGKATA